MTKENGLKHRSNIALVLINVLILFTVFQITSTTFSQNIWLVHEKVHALQRFVATILGCTNSEVLFINA